jgi:hypothetical protein
MDKTICPQCGTEQEPELFHDGSFSCPICPYIGYYKDWTDPNSDYQKLERFKEFEKGWDGYHASVPKEKDIELAKKFLKILSTDKPFVTITGDGIPFFEWDDMVIEIRAGKKDEDNIVGTIFMEEDE